MTEKMQRILDDVSRRDFLRLGTMSAVGLGLSHSAIGENQAVAETKDQKASMVDVPYERVNPKIGIIGVGGRGTSLLGNL